MDRWQRDLDRWLTSLPEDYEEVAFHCDECKGEIYVGEEYYYIGCDDEAIHVECLEDYAKTSLDVNLKEAYK